MIYNFIEKKILFRFYTFWQNWKFDFKNRYLRYRLAYLSKIHSSVLFGKYTEIQIYSSTSYLEIEENVHFRKYCHIALFECGLLKIQRNVFFNNYCSISCLGNIEIGENTIFGEGVKLYDHNHLYNFVNNKIIIERNDFKIGKIKIGKNCWIGSNVTILNNVEIGENTIIGANCLIYKSIPANSIVKLSQSLQISGK